MNQLSESFEYSLLKSYLSFLNESSRLNESVEWMILSWLSLKDRHWQNVTCKNDSLKNPHH